MALVYAARVGCVADKVELEPFALLEDGSSFAVRQELALLQVGEGAAAQRVEDVGLGGHCLYAASSRRAPCAARLLPPKETPALRYQIRTLFATEWATHLPAAGTAICETIKYMDGEAMEVLLRDGEAERALSLRRDGWAQNEMQSAGRRGRQVTTDRSQPFWHRGTALLTRASTETPSRRLYAKRGPRCCCWSAAH